MFDLELQPGVVTRNEVRVPMFHIIELLVEHLSLAQVVGNVQHWIRFQLLKDCCVRDAKYSVDDVYESVCCRNIR